MKEEINDIEEVIEEENSDVIEGNNKKTKNKPKAGKKEDNTVILTNEEIDAMNLKLKEAEDKALRMQAELINYRKRKDEEVIKMLKYANEDMVNDILPVLDNFERALKMEASEDTSKFLDGMKMIYQGLVGALSKYGVKEIESLGKPFDETVHQAVVSEEVADSKPNIILEVFQKGYMLKDKVIRPAMVKVSK